MHQLFISPADKYIPADISKAFDGLPSGEWQIRPFTTENWHASRVQGQTIFLHFGGIRVRGEDTTNPVIELSGTNVSLNQLAGLSARTGLHCGSAALIIILSGAAGESKTIQAIARIIESESKRDRIVYIIATASPDSAENDIRDRQEILRQLSMLASILNRDFTIPELVQLYPGALLVKISGTATGNKKIIFSSTAPEDPPPPSEPRMPVQRKNPLTAWIRKHLLREKDTGLNPMNDYYLESGYITQNAPRLTLEKPSETNDEVNCTLFAPKTVVPSNEFMVQVFVHTDEQKTLLEAMARLLDATARLGATKKLEEPITTGTRLSLQLSISSMIIEEPVLQLKWKGNISAVQFTVKVPADAPESDVIGKVLVLKDSVPIGVLKFKISIGTKPGTELASGTMTRFKKAFVSYASQDRTEVLKRVQMLNLIKLNFFQDLLTLEAGDQWEPQIFKNIADSDVFFLFWSKAASASQWVKKEVLYARELQSTQELPEIIPVIIEGPPVIPPPEELAFMHFNDKMIYFINANQ